MASVQASRFSVLNIDDDDSDEGKQSQKQSAKANQQQAKKKNKKKNKANQQRETEDLRNLAFSKGGKPHTGGSGVSSSVICAKEPVRSEQWKEWKDADQEFVSEAYEKDLQEAMLLSKLDAEAQKKEAKAAGTKDDSKSSSQKQKKKKGKKNEKNTMSLGEFQQDEKAEQNGGGDGFEEMAEPDPTFFKNVDNDVHKIIRKEQIQEEYTKQYIVESARTQQYEETVRKKDKVVDKLRADNVKLMADLQEVKERNQQLCMILAQGEMKGKTTVLMELDQLKQVRDELTQEVTRLTSELEKERSKVHALQSGSDKTKSGKKKN